MNSYNGILQRMDEIEEDKVLFLSSACHVEEDDKSAFVMSLLRLNHELLEEKDKIKNSMKEVLKKSKFLLAETEHSRNKTSFPLVRLLMFFRCLTFQPGHPSSRWNMFLGSYC